MEQTNELLDVFSLTPNNRHAVNITHEKLSELLKEIEPYYVKYGIKLGTNFLEEVKDDISEVSIIEIFQSSDNPLDNDVANQITNEIKAMLDSIVYVNDMNCNGLNIKRGVRLIPKPIETKWELNKSYNYTNMESKGFPVKAVTHIQLPLINRWLEIYTEYFIL